MTSSTNGGAADESLTRFARKIAHDLNNFSTVVRTYSELLLTELPESSGSHADVLEIHHAADAMVAYLSRVTRFTRATAMRHVSLDVNRAVNEAVHDMIATGDGRVILVEGGSTCELITDGEWWRDVLTELVINACEASPADTPVIVHLAIQPRADGGTALVVRVIDCGNGFADEMRHCFAEPFATTKKGVRGAGIGLTIVDAFARAMRGTLHATRETTAAGERTVVRLELPLHEHGLTRRE